MYFSIGNKIIGHNFKFVFHLNQLLLILFVIFLENAVYSRILKTRLGTLEGTTEKTRHEKYFHAYYGIPYGKAPVGNLRFEPPVKADPWIGQLNATQMPPPCPQILSHTDVYAGEEDCLFLHVYTPLGARAGQNFPVIFYIFGGQFKNEYPGYYAPDFMMSRDVVFVIPNYRLGTLGFLSTGDTWIAGNMALKDQLLAMKWTKENIYDFGGDPHKITLQGHSSGSVCAHLHTLSPLSQDYFNQAILQSGLGTSSFWDRDGAKGIVRSIASFLNCSIQSSKVMKECLQNKTAKELVTAVEKIQIASYKNLEFRPVIEDENAKEAFLTTNPLHTSYPSNDKPWLLGITKSEGAVSVSAYLNSNRLDNDPRLLFPITLSLIWSSKPDYINFVVQWMKVHYFGEQEIKNTTDIVDVALAEILSGIGHGQSLINVVQTYPGTKYLYLFDYRYVGGFTNSKGGLNGRFLGATHADELPILFKVNKTGIAKEDLEFGDEMITRWVNFAYSGNPNVPFPINTDVFSAWNPVSTDRMEFLRISRGGRMEKDYILRKYNVWRKLPVLSKYFPN